DEERCGRGFDMIVQCENCETRFHVADARIPEKGARVRCSRCHHRFHITPSSGTVTGQGPAPDISARTSDVSVRTATRGDSPGGEDELENPEFLFEESGSKGPRGKPASEIVAESAAAAESEPAPAPETPPAPAAAPVRADLEPAAAP